MTATPEHERRLRRVLARLEEHVDDDASTRIGDALCATSVDVLELPGAGLSLHSPGGASQPLAASTTDMAVLHELERTLNEGPCIDAFDLGGPIAEPDLTDPRPPRWLAFTEGALRTEARAVFGYPLQLGAARFGALNLYAARPGPLSADQHDDALVLADVATYSMISAVDGTGALEWVGELLDIGMHQLQIHQATGMVSVQLSTGIAEALSVLRARAFAEDRPISAVAADVVDRRLRFDPS